MSLRNEQCNKVCRILDDVLANRPTERDSLITAVRKAFGALETEPQWIPCSERLPDKTDDYLCSYNGCAVVDICEYDPDRNEWGFFYDGGWKVVSNVTAWMPLPEPYKGGREDA